MTGTDLIVLAPWIAFAVGLATICLLLLRSRHASGSQQPPRSGPAGAAGAASRPGRAPANRSPADGLNPQEATCPEKNAKARPQ
jgi:hypothetical protein